MGALGFLKSTNTGAYINKIPLNRSVSEMQRMILMIDARNLRKTLSIQHAQQIRLKNLNLL